MSTDTTTDPGAKLAAALEALASEPDSADALAHLSAVAGNGHAATRTPDMVQALEQATRLHRERGNFEALVRLLDLAVAAEESDDRKADLVFEQGRIYADELLRENEAVKSFERVLELRPGDETAEDALGHISLVRDNWQKILRKYLEEAKSSTDRQLTASLYLSVAELHAKYQPDESVERYLKKALEVDPRNTKASHRLDRLYRHASRWADLAVLEEQRAEAAPNREERVLAYLALAELERTKLARPEPAAEAYKKVLGIDPINARALTAIVEHYTETQAWQPLIRVYENALRAKPRGEPELGTLLQIAMIWWKKLENLDAADEYWKRIRKVDPAHPVMLEFYRAYYGADSAKLLPILQQAQRLSSGDKKGLDLALETARAAEGSKGAAERAIDLWKGVLRIEPGHTEAMDALERLYERTEKWNALLELHKESLEALSKQPASDALTNQKVDRLLRMVRIYRDRLSLDVMVVSAYGQILQLRPNHAEALAALTQRYEGLGRWNDLIAVLQKRVEFSTDTAEKAALLRRVAELWIEKFGNLQQAVRPLEDLWALDPTNADVLARLRDLYTRRRAWRSLLDLERKEEQRLATSGSRKEHRAKLVEIAKLTAERLGEMKEAIGAWNRLLEIDAQDAEALAALAGLYEREKRWPALVEILRRQAAGAPAQPSADSGQRSRVALLERAANLLAERLSQPDRAAEIYREILVLQPGHPRAMRTLQGMFAQEGRLDELVALYAKSGQWEELYEVLQQTAERLVATDSSRRIEVLSRAAEIARTELRSQDKAARAYERILALDAEQGEATQTAARALLPIYRASEKWARLLATHEVLLGFSTTVDEQLAMLREIRELCEEKLGSRGLAFSWAARAYALRPDDEALARDLERLAEAAETWDELAEIYGREIGPDAEPARRLGRLRRLADIALNHQHRLDDARKFFEQILALEPSDAAALAALEQLFAEGHSYPQLLAVYRTREARWSGAPADPARVDLLFKIAWIEEEKLNDLDAARKTLAKICSLEPVSSMAQPGAATELRALRALERIESGGGASRRAALAQVLERQLALADQNDAYIDLASRLAELYAGELARPADALAHLEQALRRDSDRRATHSAIEKLVEAGRLEPASQLAALKLLVPAYEERLRTANGEEAPRTAGRLIDFLGRYLALTTDVPMRASLLSRLAELAGEVEDTPALRRQRYDWAAERFERDSTNRELRRAFIDLGLKADRADDVAVRLGQVETAATDDGMRRELALELGALFEQPLGMIDEAQAAYRRVLAIDPEDAVAGAALERLLKGAERYADLRALLVGRKDRALDPQKRIDYLLAICDLDEGVLDDTEAAITSYKELLDVDPQSARAFRALERIYTAAERFRDLEALISAREAFALSARDNPEVRGTPESRANLRFRRADLYREKLSDLQRAVDLYEEALVEEPSHEGARRALEALLRRPEVRLRVARVLQPIYETDQAWPKLALVLGAERESLEGPDAVPLLMRLAALQEERLGARQLALSTWREALRIDPRDERARTAVERLAILLGRHADLAAAWEEAYLASDPSDLPLRADLLARSARLYERELRDMQKAETAWRRLFELDPGNPDLGKPAADALERIYESQEAWPRLIEVLRRLVEWSADVDARRPLLFRIARIQEELIVDPKSATTTYRELLDADPSDRGALDGLEKLHAAKSEWPALLDVLRRRLELESDARARRDLLFRIAQLTERELADPASAVPAYGALLDEAPDDLAALDALVRLHEAAGRKLDLLEVIERRIQLEADRIAGQARVDPKAGARDERNLAGLRMRAAALDIELGRPEAALERYREILDRDPKHEAALRGLEQLLGDANLRFRAAELLEPRYREQQDAPRLLSIFELLAEAAPDLQERLARLEGVAQLRSLAGNKHGAFEALAKAARLAVGEPSLGGLLDRLEAATPADARVQLVALYQDLAADILDATTQERVHLAVAAESDRLGDRETAREYYRRVLDGSPDNLRALTALESIYASGEEWGLLYEIYVRRAELASHGDSDVRRRYLLLGAKLCEDKLDRPLDAIPAYEEALMLQPADADISRALEARYQAAARWHELGELLERRLGFADELDEAVALRVRLAALFETELTDPERAVENYRAALGGDPNNAAAIAALERYLEDPLHGPTVAEVLEPVYAGRHDWQRLVRVCEIRLEAAEDPRARLALRRRIARIHEEQLEDLDGAFVAFTRVYTEDPGDRGTRDQLARLAGVLGAWERLATVYEDHLSAVGPDGEGAEDALRALASIYHERLADVDRARGAYGRLLERDREDELAFVSLEKLLERAGRWAELLDAYREAAQNTLDLDVRRRLLHKAAAVAEQRIDDLDVAIQLHRAVLDLDPVDSVALAALDRLYVKGERWHDLSELIERRIADRDSNDVEGFITDKLRLAELRAVALEDKNGALDIYEEILGRRPSEPRAVRALERIIVEPEYTYRVAQLLSPIYRAEDSWQKLIVIYEAELEFLDDPTERVSRLVELATLHEQRGQDRRRAFASLLRAWREEAGRGEGGDNREAALFEELCRLAESEKLFADLCEGLEREVAESLDLDLRARVYRRVAEIAETRLTDRPRAILALTHVLAAVENDEPAWDAIERLLAAEGRSLELVKSLERRATITSDPDQRRGLYQRAAAVYEESLRDAEAAIGAWRLVLEVDSDDQAALMALARLHRARGEHRELADTIERLISTASENAKRRGLRAELAALAAGALADVPRATDAWRSILAEDPKDREALLELRRIEGQAGHFVEELEALDALIELAEPGPARDTLRLEAAELVEQKLSDAETAIGRYAALLEAAAGKAGPARTALERLARERDTRALAAEVLEPAYERAGEWSALIELGELVLEGESDPGTRKAWLLKMASAAERGLSDGKSAFTHWARVVREEPTDEDARRELERLAESEAIPGELARVYEEMLGSSLDPDVSRRIALRLGELFEQKIGDEERAIVAYSQALEAAAPAGDDDGERGALRALDRLLSRAGRPRDLAEVLQKQAAAADATAERVVFLHRLGVLLAGELVDLDGALAAFRDALELDPSHIPSRTGMSALLDSEPHVEAALDVLEPIADRDGDAARQNALAERRLLTLSDDHERGALLERIAERAEQALHDPAAAFGAVARALTIDPANERLTDESERLAAAAKRPDDAASLFEKLSLDDSSRGGSPEVRRVLALRAGHAWEAVGAAEKAEARYLAILASDRDDSEALEALERIYRVRRDAGRLADVLTRRAAIELDSEAKQKFLAEAARLAEDVLGDADGAVELWRQVRAIDDTNADARSALSRILEARGRWLELTDLLSEAAQVTSDPRDQGALLGRIAALSAEKLQDLPRAITALRELLDLEPDAMAALDSLIELETRRGDELAIKEALERKLGALSAGPARIPVFRRLAELATRREETDDALGYLLEILSLDENDRAAYDAQVALLEKSERWHDLVDVLGAEAKRRGAAGDTAGELVILVRAADLWEGKLDSPESATEILERILERDKTNVRALLSLSRIAETSGDTERARTMLAGAEAAAKTPSELAELAFRRGRVEADAGEEAAALAHYRRALEAEPTHAPSLAALVEHARGAGDHVSLADLMERQLASAADAPKAARIELSRLYLDKLHQPDKARPHLEALLAATPDDAQVRELLADLHFTAGRVDEARPLYAALIETAAQQKRRGKELARLHSRLGEIADKKGDVAAALASFAEAQRLDAGHAPTLVALGRLQRNKGDWEAARKLYRSLLLQNLDADAGITKGGVYQALGEIHEQLNEKQKAIGMYERGLELDTGNEALKAALTRLRST